MTRALRKVMFRVLLKTPGRFIALFLIIVLGAGFFTGLQSAAPSMQKTADTYFKERKLADFRLLCDFGITDDDVRAAAALPEVAQASGEYAADLVGTVDEALYVFAFHSLPQEGGLTQIVVTAGRMPQAPDECVIDDAATIALGDHILVTEDNGSDTLGLLSQRTFTVVGTVQSSLYSAYERGNTSIGSGRVSSFVYLPESAFSSDYFTVLNIRLATTSGVSAFSTQYQAAIEEARVSLEAFVQERAQARLDEINEDAAGEIDDAQSELSSEKATAHDELEQAYQDLISNRTTLEQAEATYKQYHVAWERSVTELQASRSQLQAARLELDTGRQQMESAQGDLDRAREAMRALQEQIIALRGLAAIETDPAALASLQYQIAQLEAQVASIGQQVAAGEVQVAASAQELANGEAAYAAGVVRLESAAQQAADGERQLSAFAAELARNREALNQGIADYNDEVSGANDAFGQAAEEIQAAHDELDALALPEWFIQDRDEFPGYTGFKSDADRIERVSLILPWFFFLLAALVGLTAMTRLVEEHRTQIGTLKALGYTRGAIMSTYRFYAWSIGVLGGAVGVILGLAIFPQAIWSTYSTMYHMGAFELAITPLPCVIGLCGGLVAVVAATSVACRRTLRSNATVLMRPQAPKPGRRVFLERIGFVWRLLRFSQKVTVRNLFRYKSRFIMTVVGVAGCTAILVAGFGIQDSMRSVVGLQYGDISHAKATIMLTVPSSSTADTALNQELAAYDTAYAYLTAVDVMAGDRNNNGLVTYLYVPEQAPGFNRFTTFRQRIGHVPISFPPADAAAPAAILTERLAKALGVGVGDTVAFGLPGEAPKEIAVAGVMENYVYNYLYLSPASYERLFGTPPLFSSVVLDTDLPPEDLDALMTNLLSTQNVALVLPVSTLQEVLDKAVTNMSSVVWLMILAAAVLAFVVLYNLITINITERMRELATLKVLGFFSREVFFYVFRETFALTAIGMLLGLVVGIFLHGYIMDSVEVNEIMFGRIIEPASFALAAVFTLGCSILVSIFMIPRL
ncbi:MAG: ABC transporter permease, partial [Coriobacteriales bacterium]|nr:ABC transporter permease [Coriobacteriales bacterium]